MEKKTIGSSNQIKKYLTDLLNEKLQDFELVEGGMQRTVGDLIESKVSDIIVNSKSNLISETRRSRSKKSIEDVSVISNSVTYYIDPKTHNRDSEFSMPNLTSVEKIKKLFSSQDKDLIYVFVTYIIMDSMVMIENIKVFFIWELDTSILRIGALGKGQLQIKNANDKIIFTNKGKLGWYSGFKNLVIEFLEKQENKIKKQKIQWQ
jgi:hypothetical protein